MNKTLIILNGPPGCGKDTLADYIRETFGWLKLEFKGALRLDTARLFHTTLDVIREHESRKEIPSQTFLHPDTHVPMSLRQALIYTSECVMKRTYGPNIYGRRLAETFLSVPNDIAICSDGGFEGEIVPLLESGIKVRVLRLHRTGHTFAHDSRNYISGEFVLAMSEDGFDISVSDFHNDAPYARYVADGAAAVFNL
ncbi:MAG: hypothetical protein [Siphoviridae sp. ct7UA22]|nr:MAG: hypothetical protein [Siphoviridae sp. ct7UA22]